MYKILGYVYFPISTLAYLTNKFLPLLLLLVFYVPVPPSYLLTHSLILSSDVLSYYLLHVT